MIKRTIAEARDDVQEKFKGPHIEAWQSEEDPQYAIFKFLAEPIQYAVLMDLVEDRAFDIGGYIHDMVARNIRLVGVPKN